MLVLNENNTVKIPRRGYKLVKSLFGQHEEIPEDWDLKKLEEIGKIVGGGTPDSTILEYWNGKILWAIPTDITKLQTNQIENTERKITKEGLDNSSAKLLPKGTILITSRATIGECAIATKPISTNQGFQSIICDDKNFNRTYIFYSIKCHKNELLRLAYGTTFLEINKTEIKKVMLPAPSSILEQQKIASILSGVDALIESTQKTVEKTERLKKGLMQKLLTRGIGHTKFKKVKFLFGQYNEIPNEWEIGKFNEKIRLEYGSGLTARQRDNSGNPVYGSGGIIGFHSKPIVNGVGIVVARKGSLGNVFYEKQNFFPIDTVYYITKNETALNLLFLFYYLKKMKLENFAIVTSKPGISRNEIYSLKITIPPLQEQQNIASILSGVDAYIQKNQQYKERLEKLKKGLMQKLLTGQIRVKV